MHLCDVLTYDHHSHPFPPRGSISISAQLSRILLTSTMESPERMMVPARAAPISGQLGGERETAKVYHN